MRFYKSALAAQSRFGLPNHWDLIAFVFILSIFVAIVQGTHGLNAPLDATQASTISLEYTNLPYYALRTTLRMFAAIIASLIFTFTYATLAAKSHRAETVLIPILDILQSVPILGFLSFTVTFFLNLFPGATLGAECAAVFAIFTSQAWNMAFSFYQSLRTTPRDLNEVARGFQLSGWQKFWLLETPFAMPGLIWNMMMSMSGGWFFVVASEAITVGDTTIKLPGIGSYLASAIDQKRIDAVLAAVVMVTLVIIAYDQFLFRPMVAFAAKFRVELTQGEVSEESWLLNLFQRTRWLRAMLRIPGTAFDWFIYQRMQFFSSRQSFANLTAKLSEETEKLIARLVDILFYSAIMALVVYAAWQVYAYVTTTLTMDDLWEVSRLTLITLVRVMVLLLLATLIWVPISVWIGLRPRLTERIQPLAQFLAAFPANVLFPIAVVMIIRFGLNPDIWLSFLVIFGTQWYIVFNVIAGTSAFPNDLREASKNFHIRGWDWWRKVMIPGIFPYYVTGALTASGGSWNATIVAEYVKWGDDKVAAHGIGAYIAKATEAGDFPRIVLGVTMMALFVVLFNRLFWRKLFAFGEKRLRLN